MSQDERWWHRIEFPDGSVMDAWWDFRPLSPRLDRAGPRRAFSPTNVTPQVTALVAATRAVSSMA
jgi:hypothetical protein